MPHKSLHIAMVIPEPSVDYSVAKYTAPGIIVVVCCCQIPSAWFRLSCRNSSPLRRYRVLTERVTPLG